MSFAGGWQRCLPAVGCVVFSLFGLSVTAKGFEVSGEVLDTNNGPIDKALVVVSRDNTQWEARTDPAGRYVVKFPGGTLIKVTYDHSGYVAGKIDDLSGERDHSIKKVWSLWVPG